MNEVSKTDNPGSIWKRLLYMVLFMMIFRVAEIVLYLTAALGFVYRVLDKPINTSVRSLGHSIAVYLKQIADYLSFNSETEPFPFSSWPDDTVREVTNTNFD